YFGTTISVFYTGFQGGAYSYVYDGDANKDGTSGHELMYIPREKSDLLWDSDADADAYFAYAAQDPYLSKNAGKYMKRNGAYLPWNGRFDVRLLQDIKLNVGNTKNKLQFSVDVINFENLLSPDWGLNKSLITNSPLQVTGRDDATGKLKVKMRKIGDQYVKESFQDPSSVAGTWSIQLGLRYVFN
ncbi:MAG TPA: hypothetical protein PK167_02290, partial [Prolixibacteraceae bacterium]|nr:hypothetical protein [Prolixibacteraceae bacterium]